jgi:hypothetical protein
VLVKLNHEPKMGPYEECLNIVLAKLFPIKRWYFVAGLNVCVDILYLQALPTARNSRAGGAFEC